MIITERHHENPVLKPDPLNSWEAWATFNGCPVEDDGRIHFLYRAVSTPHFHSSINAWMRMSEIGYAESKDGIHFRKRRPLILPEEVWEQFGCEDPRVTRLDGVYYIFYTALSHYPFDADGIRVGVALTTDFQTIREKHLVTPFNAKAMALFPEKINGKLWTVLTANTDILPAYIALASFDNPEEMWSEAYWEGWYKSLESHALPLQRKPEDHIEVGAPPLKTKDGWLIIYSYIRDYLSEERLFGIEAALLQLDDPTKVVARTSIPLMTPEEQYEMGGTVPDVIFPSGAMLKGDTLNIYYSAADTTCCLATTRLSRLLRYMTSPKERCVSFARSPNNPIIQPDSEHPWEAKATFNPAAIYEDGAVHILYRAMSEDNTSVFGYAKSNDGFNIVSRESEPVYVPRQPFEMKMVPSGNSGCEDPRITRIGDKFYVLYTAFNGAHPPRVALTSIDVSSFLKKEWRWSDPILVSPPGFDDKDACLHPEKVGNQYLIYHRIGIDIDLAFVSDLSFIRPRWLGERRWLAPRRGSWDSVKVGIAAPPLKTKRGWLLLYHGVSEDHIYRVGAVLTELRNPARIIGRTAEPLLEPQEGYEKIGQVDNVVFPCGAVMIGGRVFVYYGGADSVTCVATLDVDKISPVEC